MNLDELTIGQAKALAAMFSAANPAPTAANSPLLGRYVLVRCRDAGVHTGVLESIDGRTCTLTDSRRLWYWKPADGQKFLSGVASAGLDASSKVGAPLERIMLTENCEIIQCTTKAEASIRLAVTDEVK